MVVAYLVIYFFHGIESFKKSPTKQIQPIILVDFYGFHVGKFMVNIPYMDPSVHFWGEKNHGKPPQKPPWDSGGLKTMGQ